MAPEAPGHRLPSIAGWHPAQVCGRKTIGTPKEAGAPIWSCGSCCRFALLCRRSSCERWLAARYQELFVAGPSHKCIVLVLKPHKLGFQVSHSLLETAHLRDHPGIGTANVAK